MSYRFHAPVVAALVASSFLCGAQPAAAASDPGLACSQGIAKTLSKCVKKLVGSHAKCYKVTGAACADGDEKIAKTLDKTYTGVRDKCGNSAGVSAAGYGPFNEQQLAYHFQDSCVRQAGIVIDRTYGEEGSNYDAADDAGKKCLFIAGKSGGNFLSGALGALGKCFAGGCGFDFSSPHPVNAAYVKNLGKLDAKTDCNYAGLVGSTSAAFLTAIQDQVPDAIAAPCDPIDATRCMMPYPNDYLTIGDIAAESGRRLAFSRHTLPRSANAIYVDPARWNETDGFSVGPMIVLQDATVDLAMTGAAPITDLAESLESDTPALMIDADTGEQQLLFWERDQNGASIADEPIIGRVGKNLKDGHRYIVALRNMKDSGGAAVAVSASFALYRDNTPTTLLPVEARRAHMEEIFDTLTGYGIARNELYLAWDFTTQSTESVAGRLLHMRDDALDNILGGGPPAFTVDTVTPTPYPNIFRQVDGTFQVPLYLNTGGIPGSTLRTDSQHVPYNDGDFFTAAFRCLIPDSATTAGAAPAVPARISLYGHGLLGSHTEVSGGNIRDMASEHNFIFCATDWTGFEENDEGFATATVLAFSNFPTFIDRQHQGILNMLVLGRLLLDPAGLSSDDAFKVGGESMIDASALFYDGNSQGGILGGVVAAFEQDLTRLVLGVPGINYSSLLNRSVDFEPFFVGMKIAYPTSIDRTLLLSLGQNIWDRTDPSGHINHVTSDPYPNTPAKKLLYQVAFGDHQVAPFTAEVAARSNGMSIHTPTVVGTKSLPEVTPYYGIPAIPGYPFDGSAIVIWDSGNPAPPTGNIPPPLITNLDPQWADLGPCAQGATGGDPHSCPRKNAAARTQKSEFLKIGGAVTDQCGALPCLAP